MNNGDISGMLSKIMSDPEMMKKISTLAGGMKSNDGNASPVNTDSNEGSGSEPVLSPELMEKLPQVMSLLGPMLNRQGSSGNSSEPASEGAMRRELLHALKPYLSDSRREAVDSIMKMGDLTEVFGSIIKKDKQ